MPTEQEVESDRAASHQRGEHDEDCCRHIICYLQQYDLGENSQRLKVCEGARSANSLFSWHNPLGGVMRRSDVRIRIWTKTPRDQMINSLEEEVKACIARCLGLDVETVGCLLGDDRKSFAERNGLK